MISKTRIILIISTFLFVYACRDANNSGIETDGDSDADSDADIDGGQDQEPDWSENCPSTVFADMTCMASTEGDRCPSTITCDCGTVIIPCYCEEYSMGYHFVCDDDCEAACESDNPPLDGGTDGGDGDADADEVEGPITCLDYCTALEMSGCDDVAHNCFKTCELFDEIFTGDCDEVWEDTKRCMLAEENMCDSENIYLPVACQTVEFHDCLKEFAG